MYDALYARRYLSGRGKDHPDEVLALIKTFVRTSRQRALMPANLLQRLSAALSASVLLKKRAHGSPHGMPWSNEVRGKAGAYFGVPREIVKCERLPRSVQAFYEFAGKPVVVPDRDGILSFQSSASDQPPRQLVGGGCHYALGSPMPLTDFVIADRKDAQQVCDAECPNEEFNGMTAKGIDPVKLGTLYAILTDTEYDPNRATCEPLCDGGEEGPWVIGVPNDLVQRLAELDAKQIDNAARKWANTEEFSSKYHNWPSEAVRGVLSDLAKLCAKAAAAKKSVLMWMSL